MLLLTLDNRTAVCGLLGSFRSRLHLLLMYTCLHTPTGCGSLPAEGGAVRQCCWCGCKTSPACRVHPHKPVALLMPPCS